MKIQQIAGLCLRLYGIYRVILGIEYFISVCLINTGIMNSKVFTAQADIWIGLFNLIVGGTLIIYAKEITSLICKGLDNNDKKE